MRRILILCVGIAWIGVGPSSATAQTVQEQINAMQATIAAQAQQIAALQGATATGPVSLFQPLLTENSASPYSTSTGDGALANNEATRQRTDHHPR